MAFLQGIDYFISVKTGLQYLPDFKTNLCLLPSPGPFPVWRNTKALAQFVFSMEVMGETFPLSPKPKQPVQVGMPGKIVL